VAPKPTEPVRAARPAAKLPLVHAQELGRFQLAQLIGIPATQRIAKLQHPKPLQHF